ncbi:uncharacterized protein [Diabrotica undecimpunctata]|uniref:uncharacterized protein n=1 Tax=Diabrotica undecimpunctata TaxID=50387 RepID=UPI003B63843B
MLKICCTSGKPLKVISDNGTQFVEANKELKLLGDFLLSHSPSLTNAVSNEGINWNFIPAKSPNFGGLCEAGVKSCKKHLKRILGNCTLTFEDFYITLVQIEAILNSRPLCPLSSSPDDFESLTPSHFLIGRRLTSLPDPDVREVPMNRLSRYQHIQMLQQHFWTRWSSDYITELQQKGKWFTEKPNLEVGQLVVLKEDNLPPCQWKMGRVNEVYVGPDDNRWPDGLTR